MYKFMHACERYKVLTIVVYYANSKCIYVLGNDVDPDKYVVSSYLLDMNLCNCKFNLTRYVFSSLINTCTLNEGNLRRD